MRVVLLAVALSAWAATSPAQWAEVGDLNRKRGEHANAVVNGQIYVFSGIDNHTDGPSEVERFDPATGLWSDVSSMHWIRSNDRTRNHLTAGASVYGDDVWLVGGKVAGASTGTPWVDVYDASQNRWRLGPDLPQAVWGGPSVIVGDSLHYFAGATGATATRDWHWSLDLTDESAGWSVEPAVPQPRVHHAGVAIGEKIYLVGGEYHHTHDGDTPTLQIYDTLTRQWTAGADMPLGRSHLEWATFAHNGEIWSVGGVDSSNLPRGQIEILIYNPALDQWREFETPLPDYLVSPGAKIVDNTLYVFGGGNYDWFTGDMVTTYALALPPARLPGDYNGNQLVDAADYTAWRDALGRPVATPYDGADGNGDQLVNQADYRVWRDHFGQAAAAAPAGRPVPAPGAAALLSALLACGGRRSRVRKRVVPPLIDLKPIAVSYDPESLARGRATRGSNKPQSRTRPQGGAP